MKDHLNFDKTIKIFSPEGRLYQVEYAFKGVSACNLTAVVVRGPDSVAACVQKKVPDKLIDPASMTSFAKITDTIGALLMGYQSDATFLVARLRMEANEFKLENGYEIPIHVLASKLSQLGNYFSQLAMIRTLCVTTVLMGIDDEKGPQIFKIDPAGLSIGYRACAAGSKEQEATTLLEKQFKKKAGPDGNATFTADQAVEVVIDTLQSVIGAEFHSGDIEVALATKDSVNFRLLPGVEVESYLNRIADKSNA